METKVVDQKITIKDGCVVIDKTAPSLWDRVVALRRRYEQVMERTQDLQRAVEKMKRSSQ